ncbi:unnamed protein product [Echinostoma caproni]|uniref:Phosphoribosylamine--glycine ligase n=1 Tax=Echinostoma caproni TaxID=27848 RepID=A0A183A929_9TREM|nr:unnamed protein product [Echinostoma caproni]
MMKQGHYQALKELQSSPNLIVLKPDKGHGVVVVDKNEYVAKIMKILDDKHKFKPDLAPDNVQLIEKQIIRELQILMLYGFITETQIKQLKP